MNLNKHFCFSDPGEGWRFLHDSARQVWWSDAGGQKLRQQKRWGEQSGGEEIRDNIRPLPWRYHPRTQHTRFLSWLSLAPPPRSGRPISPVWSQDPCRVEYAGQPEHNRRVFSFHFFECVCTRVVCTHLQWKSSLWGDFGHQALFLSFLEFPEVFLNQECGIELPHGYFVICWTQNQTHLSKPQGQNIAYTIPGPSYLQQGGRLDPAVSCSSSSRSFLRLPWALHSLAPSYLAQIHTVL